MRTTTTRGLFIALEGPEGSGKSTQIRHLSKTLKNAGYSVVRTREPGGTTIAEAIRDILLRSSSREPITAQTEALLILAARSQHVRHFIRPALDAGSIVLCDRFSDSTLAYQGFARGVNLSWLKAANQVATEGLTPDFTLLLDVPVSIGLRRRRSDRRGQNRLDQESLQFHRLVRRGFLALANQSPNTTIIDASRPAEEVRVDLERVVLRWVARRRRIRAHAVS
jgi:dTMP kinase